MSEECCRFIVGGVDEISLHSGTGGRNLADPYGRHLVWRGGSAKIDLFVVVRPLSVHVSEIARLSGLALVGDYWRAGMVGGVMQWLKAGRDWAIRRSQPMFGRSWTQ